MTRQTQATVSITDVTIKRNPVYTGETFVIAVGIFSFDPDPPEQRLPFRLGKRKEIR